MRLVIDITTVEDDRLSGTVLVSETAEGCEFSSWLELMALLEGLSRSVPGHVSGRPLTTER